MPHRETLIARVEIVLLRITGRIGDVRFAILAEDFAVGVDHHQCIEQGVVGPFEHADRQHHFQFRGQRGHASDGRVILDRCRQVIKATVFVDAEVRRFEQFLDQDDFRALLRRIANQPLGIGDVGLFVPAALHLCGCKLHNFLPGTKARLPSGRHLLCNTADTTATDRLPVA